MAKYKIQKGWLNTRDGKLYAPKTLIDNVYDEKTGTPYSEILEDHYEAFDELKGEVELLAQNSAEKGHRHKISYKPTGTINTPTFTGIEVETDDIIDDTTEETYLISDIGELAEHEYQAPSLTANVSNKCLILEFDVGQHIFNQGALPTTSEQKVHIATSNHAHKVTASGTISTLEFKGDDIILTTGVDE
jgi:hypothetical protein